jgi:hypothetical protein
MGAYLATNPAMKPDQLGMRVAALERGLFVAGIGIYPEALRGRTFARAIH